MTEQNNLSRTLQQSLQEVLLEVGGASSLGDVSSLSSRRNSLLTTTGNPNLGSLGLGGFTSPTVGTAAAAGGFHFNLSAPTISAAATAATTNSATASRPGTATASLSNGLRPSAALGISSEELLLAAATEKRMLEQSIVAATAARPQTLQEKTAESRRLYQQSLLALMKGKGDNNNLSMSTAATTPTSNNMNLFSNAGVGAGLNFNNAGLLQQGFFQQFKQPAMQQPSLTSATTAAAMPPMAENETKTAIKVLGTSLRKKDSPYLDVSALKDPDISDKRTRGGVTEPFPEKLHRMLEEVEKEGKSDVISFFSHGRAFAVHDPDRFINEVMPKYFKQSRLSSFQRQLNLYGFTRITSGIDAGGYYHELFLKGRPNLAVHMRRVGLPQGEDRRKMRAKNQRSEPNFYAMGHVKDATPHIPGLMK